MSAFRDRHAEFAGQGAQVLGVSMDTLETQTRFAESLKTPFPLLADPDATVTEAYGAKMPLVSMAKRWTFIIDPTLTIRQVQRDVDPSQDAQRVATEIARLKAEPAKGPLEATPGP